LKVFDERLCGGLEVLLISPLGEPDACGGTSGLDPAASNIVPNDFQCNYMPQTWTKEVAKSWKMKKGLP
jgi:hypothetical protein